MPGNVFHSHLWHTIHWLNAIRDSIDTGVAIAVTRLSLCLVISHYWGMTLFQRQVKYVENNVLASFFLFFSCGIPNLYFVMRQRKGGDGRGMERRIDKVKKTAYD